MLRQFLKISLFVLILFSVKSISATHLVGGFISYQYIGQNSGGTRYKIIITSYRDCKSGSLEFADDIDICVYNRRDEILHSTFNFRRGDLERVKPLGRTDCPGSGNVCLEKTTYTDNITLPNNSFGYIVKWETCCRNTQVNLKDDISGDPYIGQTYEAVIPPTNITNSSPFFTEVPVPFICLNDTTELNNYAIDPDGDSLVYKLATPWIGTTLGNQTPGCASFYSPPIDISLADYKSGYNGNIPFGSNGISLINSRNGITTFLARQTGNYAVAIDLFEYRRGIGLLSKTRLDLQILVVNCTPNNKPIIANSIKRYTIVAGEKLCFDVIGKDKDLTQNISLKGIGNLLTGANGFIGNRATFNPVTGKGTISSQFCWQTSCNTNDSFLFTAQIIDDGCPSKFTYVNFNIIVKPFSGKVTVSGPINVCQNSKGNIYTITPTANTANELFGIKYNVSVNNGVLKSQVGRLLTIDWDMNVLSGSIEVEPESQYGCKGPKFIYNVPLKQAPPLPIITAIDTVCENINKIYTTLLTGGFTYQWWVKNGSVLGGNNSNSINITWGAPGPASAKLVQYNQFNCPSDTALLEVWISKPVTSAIIGSTTVCPNTKGLDYAVVARNGSSYRWFVTGGVIVAGGNSNAIQINWGNQGLGSVKVIEVNKFGCFGDTITLIVNKTYALIASNIVGDISVCELTTNVKYSLPFTKHSTYNWSISGGVIISGNLTNQIIVNWGIAGPGSISMYETSFDSVNNLECISNVVVKAISIRPYPSTKIINGDFEVCQYTGAGIYTVNGLPKSKYVWEINGDSANIVGQLTNSIIIPYTVFGNFNIKVTEISEFGCIGIPIDSVLVIHPKPTTTPILGDTIICYPNFNNFTYTTTGLPNSNFDCFVDGGSALSPSITPQITVNWNGKQLSSLKVLETSEFGCVGDTLRQNIFFDRPSLYLNFTTVNPPPSEDNGIDLYWKLINAPRYNNQIFIERREAGTANPFITVGEVNGSIITFNNGNISTDFNAWEYRIKGFDLCGQVLYTSLHTNILLSGKKVNGYEVSLDFTPYIGWGSSNIQYDVYRQLKSKTGYDLYESNVTNFKAYYNNGLEHFTQCYRIKATKIGTDTVTWSNDVCLSFDPIIFIPTAFSLNDDEFNETFLMKGGALKSLEIMVYNRWGEKLWTGFDINAQWDGKYKEKDQPQGVYSYYCRYEGFDGRKYSTKGTITLLR